MAADTYHHYYIIIIIIIIIINQNDNYPTRLTELTKLTSRAPALPTGRRQAGRNSKGVRGGGTPLEKKSCQLQEIAKTTTSFEKGPKNFFG